MTSRPSLVLSLAIQASMLAVGSLSFGDVIAASSFDAGQDDWILTASTVWSSGGGNPGGFLFGAVQEPDNITAAASAPAPFLGCWAPFEDVGQLRFDYRRISNGGGSVIEFIPLTVVIKGGTSNPNGAAKWTGDIITRPSPWQTFAAPIAEDAWEVSAGSWEDILSNVTKLTIQIELVSNTLNPEDENGLDNVVLETIAEQLLGDLNADSAVNGADLGILLGSWGGLGGDLNCDGTTDGADLGVLLGEWTG